jgi:hypothetical protein
MQIWNVEKAMEMSAADADAIPVLCCAVLRCGLCTPYIQLVEQFREKAWPRKQDDPDPGTGDNDPVIDNVSVMRVILEGA